MMHSFSFFNILYFSLLILLPKKEWNLESKGNRPKWHKSGNMDREKHGRYHMIVQGKILIMVDGILMKSKDVNESEWMG